MQNHVPMYAPIEDAWSALVDSSRVRIQPPFVEQRRPLGSVGAAPAPSPVVECQSHNIAEAIRCVLEHERMRAREMEAARDMRAAPTLDPDALLDKLHASFSEMQQQQARLLRQVAWSLFFVGVVVGVVLALTLRAVLSAAGGRSRRPRSARDTPAWPGYPPAPPYGAATWVFP